MPYTPPPTFVDDAILSAAQLNVLSDNQEYFSGLAQAVNVPFALVEPGLGAAGTASWQIRHRLDWLNVYVSWYVDPSWNDHHYLEVDYNSSSVYTEESMTGTGAKWVGIDLSAEGLTVGNWYDITIRFRAHDAAHGAESFFGSSYARVLRLLESGEDLS